MKRVLVAVMAIAILGGGGGAAWFYFKPALAAVESLWKAPTVRSRPTGRSQRMDEEQSLLEHSTRGS